MHASSFVAPIILSLVLIAGPVVADPTAPQPGETDLLSEALAAQDEDPRRARSLMEAAAATGDPEALHGLATFIALGIGGPPDRQRGRELREQAVEAGSIGAALTLGLELLRADEPSEQKRGVELLATTYDVPGDGPSGPVVRAVAAGGLGQAYVFGDGVEEDVARGVGYLLESDADGLADGYVLYLLGRTFEGGWPGAEVDLERAHDYFRRAAEGGFPAAQWRHAMRLLEATPPDEAGAWRLVRLAAEAGHLRAMISAATMLATGQGVEEDDPEARRWYERAVRETRSAHALRGLGYMLMSGEGGRADVPRGLAYLRLAAEADDPIAREVVKQFEAQVKEADRRKAARLAKKWVDEHGEPQADRPSTPPTPSSR